MKNFMFVETCVFFFYEQYVEYNKERLKKV